MFDDDITVFHLNDDSTFSKCQFEDVYFEHNKRIKQVDKGVENASTGLIVIPLDSEIDIHEKDIVVDGLIEENLTDNFRISELKKKYEIYTVVSVDNCRKGGLPHWEVGVN